MPVIYIKDLVVEAKHGVHQHEKQQAQRFIISVELAVDTARAAQTDDLNDTINWSEVRDIIVETVQTNSFNLLERLAQVIADRILADKRAQSLVISIDKPDAFPSGTPGVRLEAERRPL
jgi:dihydroneopterin aldolase